MQPNNQINHFSILESTSEFVWNAQLPAYGLFSLLTAGFTDSILWKGDLRIHKLIAVVLPSEATIDHATRLLSIFPKRLLSTRTSAQALHEVFRCAHDDLFAFAYESGGHSDDILDVLSSVMKTGIYADTPFCAVPVVLFIGVVPEQVVERFSVILDVQDADITLVESLAKPLLRELLLPYLTSHWRSCLQKLHAEMLETQDISDDAKVLQAAGLMVEHALRSEEADAELTARFHQQLTQAIQIINEQTANYGESNAIASIFVDLLRRFVREGILAVCPLSNYSQNEGNDLSLAHTILIGSAHYYLTDETFRKICQGIPFATPNSIKQALANVDVLCTEGQGRIYLSKKLHIQGLAGGKRFLWLRKSSIDPLGKLALQELGGK